jgi:hypothetical protein
MAWAFVVLAAYSKSPRYVVRFSESTASGLPDLEYYLLDPKL